MMAAFLLLAQLLFAGTLIIPAHTQKDARCDLLPNATPSNVTVQVTPAAYRANTTYTVTMSDNRTSTSDKTVSNYLLQALSPQNVSMGQWKVEKVNCSSIETAVLTAPQKTANWTSPSSNVSSVEIRAYIIFSDNSAELKTVTLSKGKQASVGQFKQQGAWHTKQGLRFALVFWDRGQTDTVYLQLKEGDVISPTVRRQGKDTGAPELTRGFSEPERTTAVPSTTPNSVSMVQSSSFFTAVLQLPLFLFTSKLLS